MFKSFYSCTIKFYDKNDFNCAQIGKNNLTIIEEEDNNTTSSYERHYQTSLKKTFILKLQMIYKY